MHAKYHLTFICFTLPLFKAAGCSCYLLAYMLEIPIKGTFLSAWQDQWCKQDQILKTKTKTADYKTKTKTKLTRPRPRPPEVNKGTWRI